MINNNKIYKIIYNNKNLQRNLQQQNLQNNLQQQNLQNNLTTFGSRFDKKKGADLTNSQLRLPCPDYLCEFGSGLDPLEH